ncbi:MAG: DNA topoisomerase IB [Planctomycetes bacterium]|nr:DNA topoisomerase IB [Planctomycetota bacterium]
MLISWNKLADATEPEALAKLAQLRYVTDDEPGIERRKAGGGFSYIDADGNRVRSRRTRQRIESLVIPPAWTDVWIAADEEAHLQVTGRDDQGRKQYLYHERWRHVSNLAKFRRMLDFGRALPKVRREVHRRLSRRKHSREKVCSLVLALLDETSLRVGNEEYVRENGSYGLTTFRRRHVHVNGAGVSFRFRGKSGVTRTVELRDKRVAKLVERCRELSGRRLFVYEADEGRYEAVTSDDVNEHLQSLAGDSFTTKDFRTWKASAFAAGRLFEEEAASKRRRRSAISRVVKETAALLGNTPSVCRSAYIHPLLLDAFLEGDFPAEFRDLRIRRDRWRPRDEQILLHFLKVTHGH